MSDDPRSDLELIRAINEGDESAFAALYLRYRDRVASLAFRFTRHHDDALDGYRQAADGHPEHILPAWRASALVGAARCLLALGRTSEESEQLQQQSGQGLFSDEASALIISQAINSTVSGRMQKLFGVSRIKIDPQGLTTETNPTARGPQVTIEQQFANNITLSYSTNVSQSSQQIIQGEYYVNRNISVVGTRDQNGVVSFDVRVRRRKK